MEGQIMRRKFNGFSCFPADSIHKLGTVLVTVLVESCICEKGGKKSKLNYAKSNDCLCLMNTI